MKIRFILLLDFVISAQIVKQYLNVKKEAVRSTLLNSYRIDLQYFR